MNLGEIGSHLGGPSIQNFLHRLTADPGPAAPAGEVARAVPTTLPISGAPLGNNTPAYVVRFSDQAIRQYLALAGRTSLLQPIELLGEVIESAPLSNRLLNDGSTGRLPDGRSVETATSARTASAIVIDYGTLNAIAQSTGQMPGLAPGRLSTRRNARSTGKRRADPDDAAAEPDEYAEYAEADQSTASQSAATALRAIRMRSLPRRSGYPRPPL